MCSEQFIVPICNARNKGENNKTFLLIKQLEMKVPPKIMKNL